MRNIYFVFVALVLGISSINAQEFHFGIRGGTNFGKILGPGEEGVDEKYSYGNGFHFGIEALYSFNDYFSLGTEINYNQIGAKYHYQGKSYHIFDDEKTVLYNDDVEYNLNISNSYITIPLNFFIRPHRKVEFKIGGYLGFLINPTATGKMRFGSKFNQVLNYNYYTDTKPDLYGYRSGYLNIKNPEAPDDPTKNLTTRKVAHAYFQYPTDDYKSGKYYNLLDLGLNAGINYYINSSLYLGLNLQYGLSDITNDKLDRSLKSLGGNGDSVFDGADYLIYRNDKDTNLNFQISLGFRF